MYNEFSHRVGDMPDSLDDFLAQLLGDIPGLPSLPTVLPQPPLSLLPSTSALGLAPTPAVHGSPNPELSCQWMVSSEPLLICGASLPKDPKQTCAHLRQVHEVRGNEKVTVNCCWHDCDAPPMQRGSLIRHVLSVHLGLLRWQCEVCGRMFSRKGTGHACVEPTEG